MSACLPSALAGCADCFLGDETSFSTCLRSTLAAFLVYYQSSRNRAAENPVACRRREGEGLPFSEEVLVGRGDIDERRERMAELEAQVGGVGGIVIACLAVLGIAWLKVFHRAAAWFCRCLRIGQKAAAVAYLAIDLLHPTSLTQVAEVTAQNEYQLKLRDLALNEKVRELTDKAATEAAAAAERCVAAGPGFVLQLAALHMLVVPCLLSA